MCAVVGVVKQCKNTTYNPNQSDVPHPLALPGVPAPYNTWTCVQLGRPPKHLYWILFLL